MPAPAPSSTAAPQSSSPPPPSKYEPPHILLGIKHFWQRVTEGLEMGQLMSQVKADATSGFRFYQRDYNMSPGGEPRKLGLIHTAQALMWAILSKLSPARRVLLLIGVLLLILPGGGFQIQRGSEHFEIHGPSFQFWGGAVLFLLLMLEIADRVVMKRDLEIARDIQSWLLPNKPPEVPGLAIAFATRPANTVAGDYYDVFPRPGSQDGSQDFLFAVADVAGKSIPAALLMATFQASLKTLSSTPCSLRDLVTAMNRYACGNSQGGLRFTTAFLAEYDPASRVLNYINAGHNNPILRRSTGQVERLVAGGLPLGIQVDASYETGAVTLASGDWLVVFTDGLVEAINQFGEEYGEERLLSALDAGASLTPEALLDRVIANVNLFVEATPQHDDITCMLIRVI